MSATSLHRHSSYSLFPTCRPIPSQSILASTDTSNNTINLISSWRSSSASSGKAVNILAKADRQEGQCHLTESKHISTDITILRVIKKLKRHSANMSQLIPLKLAARSSSPFTTLPPRSSSSLSTSSLYTLERPSTPLRNPSIKRERPGSVTGLTILPYTQEEWRKIMEEVKHLYAMGQYKHCSMRCKQIIKGIKDPYRVHPLYSIYLSFFAASSLEITAASLNNYASVKLPLYQEALAFYQKAESYVEYASFSTDPSAIPSSSRHSYAHPPRQDGFNPQHISHHSCNSSSSSTNSVYSSTDSVFSHRSSSACSVSSSFTSPIEEESNIHRLHRSQSSRSSSESLRPAQQQRVKKKVSFSVSSSLLTMYSENDIPAVSINTSTLIDSFPSPPSRSPSPPMSPLYSLKPVHTRYILHLADLSKQLQYHISSLHQSIHHLSHARASRRSTGSDVTFAVLSDEIGSPRKRFDVNSDIEQSEERQILDIQARIAKLKEDGWQKKRFDPTRYINLCEKALDEVTENEYF